MPASTAEADGDAHAAVSNSMPEGSPGAAQSAEPTPAADAGGDANVQMLLHSLLSPLKSRPQPWGQHRASAAGSAHAAASLKSSADQAGPSTGQPAALQQEDQQPPPPLPLPPAPRQRPPVRREGHSQNVLHVPRPLPQALCPRLDNGIRGPPHPFDPAAARAAWGHEHLPPGPNHYAAQGPPPYRMFPNAAPPHPQGALLFWRNCWCYLLAASQPVT